MSITLRGMQPEDEIALEPGRGSVYVRTGGTEGVVCMLTPRQARAVADAIVATADRSCTACLGVRKTAGFICPDCGRDYNV